MDANLLRKEFVSGLIDVLSQGISQNRLDDAEIVLAAVRILRPQMAELDTFDAWIAMKRGFWADAIRLLNNLDSSTSNWSLGKALLAFCQYATGDSSWTISANQVLENGKNAEAIGLVKLLLNPDSGDAAAVSEEPATTSASSTYQSMNNGMFLRA